jgi:hypothetical protein
MKLGRERPKAWIYSTINPLLEGLRIETSFLERRNWTFAATTGTWSIFVRLRRTWITKVAPTGMTLALPTHRLRNRWRSAGNGGRFSAGHICGEEHEFRVHWKTYEEHHA